MTTTGKSKPINRRRCIRFHITATEEEAALIRERMDEVGISNMGAYARKMMINGCHITLDLKDIQEMTAQLGRVGNNINQISRRANESGSIHATDMEDIKRHMDEIWSAAREILSQLAKIK
ncbi:MAG: MobC family plasmid mobilization relaxosome protein [Defluviitaleaceae bacterium]|nr:MobC family plasmid mobilization relaxosome protein [Defluviitaleaceae bacterium]